MRKRNLIAILLAATLACPLSASADRPDIRDGKGWLASIVIPHIDGHSRVQEYAQDRAVEITKHGRWAFIAWAKAEVKEDPPVDSDYSYTSTSSTELNRKDLVSILWTNEWDMGGEHPTELYNVCSVGLVHREPKVLELRDLFRAGVDSRTVAAQAIIDELKKDDDADDVQNGKLTARTPGLVTQFYLNDKSIVFVLSPDITGKYAVDGTRFVNVPYSTFSKELDPDGPLAPVL